MTQSLLCLEPGADLERGEAEPSTLKDGLIPAGRTQFTETRFKAGPGRQWIIENLKKNNRLRGASQVRHGGAHL